MWKIIQQVGVRNAFSGAVPRSGAIAGAVYLINRGLSFVNQIEANTRKLT